MTVIALAKRTAGIGCIKGETYKYNKVKSIEDYGNYYTVVIHENRKIRHDKKDWKIIIVD